MLEVCRGRDGLENIAISFTPCLWYWTNQMLLMIRANSIHGFLIIFYLFLTLLDLDKVSNPFGGVLTSSALNTLQ